MEKDYDLLVLLLLGLLLMSILGTTIIHCCRYVSDLVLTKTYSPTQNPNTYLYSKS